MSSSRIKIGIYFVATMIMGVIGVSGSLATIGNHFDKDITIVAFGIISIPCLTVIPSTLVVGKLMDFFAKKSLTIIGISLILICGTLPAFVHDFTLIMVLRGIFGIGIGFVQALSSAIVSEHFKGDERSRVQGRVTSAQMIGCAIMVFAGGWLGSIGWNLAFLVYLFAIISLVGALVFIPHKRPAALVEGTGGIDALDTASAGEAASTVGTVGTRGLADAAKGSPLSRQAGTPEKILITKAAWGWIILMFLFYLTGQVYSNAVSSLVADKNLGDAMQSGLSIAFFCIGGMIMGILYWRILAAAKRFTYSLGLFILAVSYLIMIFGENIFLIHLGSFVCGMAFAICIPRMIVGTANSVATRSTSMAVSLAACFQNFGMFISPLVMNPFAEAMLSSTRGGEGGFLLSQMALLIAAVMIAVIGAVMLFVGKGESEYRGNE